MTRTFGLILTGGSGTRLWPRSREDLPKQFLALYGPRTLLQDTVSRMLRLLPMDRLRAVTGGQWSRLVAHQVRETAPLPRDFIVREPVMRNTAPAILLGCEALREAGAGGEDIVIVTPSDHIVKDPEAFASSLRTAVRAAEAGFLTTLGVKPDRPETGFGYIRKGRDQGDWALVERFVEKPDLKTAEAWAAGGDYLWNSGVFVFSLATLAQQAERTAPDLASCLGQGTASLLRDYETLPVISFDRAVMEKADRAAVVPLDAGWSDVGSWDALHDILPQDGRGNVTLGDVRLSEAENCLVDSRHRLTAVSGVSDLVVVDSPDALFITARGRSQDVRKVVKALKDEGRREVSQISECSRPWGRYRVLSEAERHRVRQVTVYPGRALPPVQHRHSLEYWVILQGAGRLGCGGEVRWLHESDGTVIPRDTPAFLENCGRIDLEMIVVQAGEYLGEDDAPAELQGPQAEKPQED